MSSRIRTDTFELCHAVQGPVNEQDPFFHARRQWTPPPAEEQGLRSRSSEGREDLVQAQDEVADERQEVQGAALPDDPSAPSQHLLKPRFKEEHVRRSDFHRNYDASIWENLPDSEMLKAVANHASQYYGERELIRPMVPTDQSQEPNGTGSVEERPSRPAQASTSRPLPSDLAEREESTDNEDDEDDVERFTQITQPATGREQTVAHKNRQNKLYHARVKARRSALAPEARALEEQARKEYNRVYRKVMKAKKLIDELQTEMKDLSSKGMEAESQSVQQRLDDATQELQSLQEQAKQARQKMKEHIRKAPLAVAASEASNVAQTSGVISEGREIVATEGGAELNMLKRLKSSALVALAIFIEECVEAHVPLRDATGAINADLLSSVCAAQDQALAERIRSAFLPVPANTSDEMSEDDPASDFGDDDDQMTEDEL